MNTVKFEVLKHDFIIRGEKNITNVFAQSCELIQVRKYKPLGLNKGLQSFSSFRDN